MSEPELPGIPPAPRPSRTPWYRRLFARRKWPGWASIGLGGLPYPLRLFRLGEDIDFAINTVRSLGGELGLVATILASPFFALALIAYGVGHLLFVGEPQRALRHQAWTYLSWAIFGVCLTAMIITAGWGAIQIYINRQIAAGGQSQFWYLTDKQKTDLGKALNAIPDDQRFPIYFRLVLANAQAQTLGNDLAEVFREHGHWSVAGAQDAALRADLVGINFVVGLDQDRIDKDQPPHLMELWQIFTRAGIKTGIAIDPHFDNNSSQLAIGSRPSDW
jgi:hypothetical protein